MRPIQLSFVQFAVVEKCMRHMDEQELGRGGNRHLILQMVLLKQGPPMVIPTPDSVTLHTVKRSQLEKGRRSRLAEALHARRGRHASIRHF